MEIGINDLLSFIARSVNMQNIYKKDGNEINLIEENDLDWEKISMSFDPTKFTVASQSARVNRKVKLIEIVADVATKIAVDNGTFGTIEKGISFQSYNAGVRYSNQTPIFAFSCNGNGNLNYYSGRIEANERLLFSFIARLD